MRRLALVVVAAICMAPVPGDIGGCGQVAEDLDPVVFLLSRSFAECRRCEECNDGEDSRCERVCAPLEGELRFPVGCFPLVHDGTVCLRALDAASCSAIGGLLEQPVQFPSECNFCPADEERVIVAP